MNGITVWLGCRGIILNLEYQVVCHVVGIRPPPPPPQTSVSPPLDPKGGGRHSLAGERVGRPNSDDWIESLALCRLGVIILDLEDISFIHGSLNV